MNTFNVVLSDYELKQLNTLFSMRIKQLETDKDHAMYKKDFIMAQALNEIIQGLIVIQAKFDKVE